jgi:hypothetical protein
LLDRPRTLWADAISINQQDVPERNAQVALMRDIYSAAQCVFVCLGQHDRGSAQLLDSFFDAINVTALPASSRESFVLSERTVRAFHELMRWSYWRRAWIIQEIVLAANVRLFCGNARIPWLDFVMVYRNFYHKSIQAPSPEPQAPGGMSPEVSPKKCLHGTSRNGNDGVAARDTLVGLRKKDSQSLLLDVMALEHPFECFDIRDRVFGVLGLVTDAATFHTSVDYRSSIEVLFCTVLEQHMKNVSKDLSAFLPRISSLANHLNLDVMQCLKMARSLSGSNSAFLGPFTYTKEQGPFTVLSTSVLSRNAAEREVRLQRTSQTLRKYVEKRFFTVRRSLLKANLFPDDHLCLLGWCSALHTSQEFDTTRFTKIGLYAIYRPPPRVSINPSHSRLWLAGYCLSIETEWPDNVLRYDSEYEGYANAVYAHFDDPVPYFEDNGPSIDRALHVVEGHGVSLYISLPEILKIALLGASLPTRAFLWQDSSPERRKPNTQGENIPRNDIEMGGRRGAAYARRLAPLRTKFD